ncbi:MAG: magnesium transporter [Candidatus Rokuibacteriota bacterium]
MADNERLLHAAQRLAGSEAESADVDLVHAAHPADLASVILLASFIAVNLSGMAGTVIPMLSKRIGFDPALTAGPFETAFRDVLGVTIFLSLATALLRWLTRGGKPTLCCRPVPRFVRRRGGSVLHERGIRQ